MSGPAENKPSWTEILRLNVNFVLAVLSVAYGWFFWSRASLDWFGFWFIGACGLAGGVALFVATLVKCIRLIRNQRRWTRFQRLGANPRGDRMAREEEILGGRDRS